jgi:hypothetical protein
LGAVALDLGGELAIEFLCAHSNGRHVHRPISSRSSQRAALQNGRGLWSLPHMGQTVPKRPLWDTFRTEKPKVFWAFCGVQIPSAPPFYLVKSKAFFSDLPHRAFVAHSHRAAMPDLCDWKRW